MILAIECLLKRRSDYQIHLQELEKIAMFPIPNCFEGLDFFDVRYDLCPDREHNYAGGLLKYVLSNLKDFVND